MSKNEVSEVQRDTEKAFRDNKKAEIQKDGPTEAVDDTDGCISDAVEYAKQKITGEAQPKKKKGASVFRASPKSICETHKHHWNV